MSQSSFLAVPLSFFSSKSQLLLFTHNNTCNNNNETIMNETILTTRECLFILCVCVCVCAERVLLLLFSQNTNYSLFSGVREFLRISHHRHHQNLAKRRTSAIRATLKAESSKCFGSCKAIFSTSMASLIDGDKVAERDAWVVNSSSSTLMSSTSSSAAV